MKEVAILDENELLCNKCSKSDVCSYKDLYEEKFNELKQLRDETKPAPFDYRVVCNAYLQKQIPFHGKDINVKYNVKYGE